MNNYIKSYHTLKGGSQMCGFFLLVELPLGQCAINGATPSSYVPIEILSFALEGIHKKEEEEKK